MAEKEYIEREALIEEINSLQVSVTGLRVGKSVLGEYIKHYKDSIIKIINEQPDADVVKVVRCKDCKYPSFIKSCSKYECSRGCGALKFSNDFCSYGEREENNV